jgi:hypothetical protein
MKESLIKLLFEEYKQICLFEDLEKNGINLTKITVNNSDIVFDLIGFPKNNTLDYDFNVLNGMPHNPKNGIEPDENIFSRDWLFDKYYEAIFSVNKIQKIEIKDNRLRMTELNDEKRIKEILNEFVEWLFEEYKNLK